jgi:acetyl-CoA synthetase
MRPREIDPGVKSYAEACETFRWHVPEFYNIAEDVCARHAANPATANAPALIFEDAAGKVTRYTFSRLNDLSARLASALAAQGLAAGDRLAILLPQRPETAIAHMAAYRLGLIAIPLTVLFRRDALGYRLQNSGARGIVLGAESLPLLEELLPTLPELKVVTVVGEAAPALRGVANLRLWDAIQAAQPRSSIVNSRADDPAMIVYTSGTTGNPKGALHAHRYLIGHLPGFELSHNLTPRPGDSFWTPADWAWVGGLMDVLLTAWHYALPVLSFESTGAYDPERAFRMLEKHGIRNAFIPPTALKMMAQVPGVDTRFKLSLRTIMSGGEALGAQTLSWAETMLKAQVNEIYGQTEINYIVGNCAPLWPVRPGSMGKPYPGHRLAVLDAAGRPVAPGTMGELGVLRGQDPVFFLEYWMNPDATRAKFIGDWAFTGDLAVEDEQGYLWFKGRADDVIISAGHRIGPNEIEGVIQRHPAVALNAVVASPDALRGDIVKAFVKLRAGHVASDELKRELQEFVKDNLARHEYPREIEFIDEFPLTTTGKILRRELRQRELERHKSAPNRR